MQVGQLFEGLINKFSLYPLGSLGEPFYCSKIRHRVVGPTQPALCEQAQECCLFIKTGLFTPFFQPLTGPQEEVFKSGLILAVISHPAPEAGGWRQAAIGQNRRYPEHNPAEIESFFRPKYLISMGENDR